MLVCPNCKTKLNDPGGDAKQYRCGNCGFHPVYRQEEANGAAFIGATLGAMALGVFTGGAGAIVGALLGGAIGYGSATEKKAPK